MTIQERELTEYKLQTEEEITAANEAISFLMISLENLFIRKAWVDNELRQYGEPTEEPVH
jgi:hypothetical protein